MRIIFFMISPQSPNSRALEPYSHLTKSSCFAPRRERKAKLVFARLKKIHSRSQTTTKSSRTWKVSVEGLGGWENLPPATVGEASSRKTLGLAQTVALKDTKRTRQQVETRTMQLNATRAPRLVQASLSLFLFAFLCTSLGRRGMVSKHFFSASTAATSLARQFASAFLPALTSSSMVYRVKAREVIVLPSETWSCTTKITAPVKDVIRSCSFSTVVSINHQTVSALRFSPPGLLPLCLIASASWRQRPSSLRLPPLFFCLWLVVVAVPGQWSAFRVQAMATACRREKAHACRSDEEEGPPLHGRHHLPPRSDASGRVEGLGRGQRRVQAGGARQQHWTGTIWLSGEDRRSHPFRQVLALQG